MVRSKEIMRRVVQMVMDRRLSAISAAELLETNVRTVYNYVRRYSMLGAEGLVDHRRGHHRKLTPEIERSIIECKLQRLDRSACWIRNWLKLGVSVECVRKVLVKYELNDKCANVLRRKAG